MPICHRLALGVVVFLALASSAGAQQSPRFEHQQARVWRLENAALLTGPSKESPRAIVISALRERGVSESTLASLVVTAESRNARTGVVDVRFEQRVAGLSVYDAYVRAALTAAGEVIQIIDASVAVPRALAGARASAQQALRAALGHVHPEFSGTPAARGQNGNTTVFAGGPFFHADPTVTRVAIPLTDGSLRAGYLVETWTEQRNLLNETLVGEDGAVLAVELRTNRETGKYNVFAVNPDVSTQTVVDGPAAAPGAPSPQGWLSNGPQRSVDIAGNNVRAYLDVDGNNTSDGGGTPVSNGKFLTEADLTITPSAAKNRNVAVQNLFYLNNVTHDLLYQHGFTEAAGNFQENNFGKGGRGSDSVDAEAQDGSDTDNADFATPRDGQNPRMQMYLWSGKPSHYVVVNAPTPATYEAAGAQFGPALTLDGLTGPIALANDGTGASTSDACEALPASSLSGLIALIDRGTCDFVVKTKNAQNAGAVGVIIANNRDATEVIILGGTDATITIPTVSVSQNAGQALRAATNVTMKLSGVISRDGDLDSDIVYHEYGHGLTWRMIGRMSGPMSGAIGEGMSDVLSIVINDDDVVGEYSETDSRGIRSAAYHNYPRTYGDVVGEEVHFDGEVYGAIGWQMWELFRSTLSSPEQARAVLLDYLVEGMTFTPAGPKFEDMRDGILAAVRASAGGVDHECKVWQSFARYGVGVGAKALVQGATVKATESFATPAGCPSLPPVAP
jgi:extracellular elastinolytic metalloproteinase